MQTIMVDFPQGSLLQFMQLWVCIEGSCCADSSGKCFRGSLVLTALYATVDVRIESVYCAGSSSRCSRGVSGAAACQGPPMGPPPNLKTNSGVLLSQ